MQLRRVVAVLAILAGVASVTAPTRATIEEQRSRLPPPAECEDPVIGVWKSHKWDPRYADWTIFTLEIRRVPGSANALIGRISNHQWSGTPADEQPAQCQPGAYEWVVSMDAQGTVDTEGRIVFGGIGQWRLDQVLCNEGPWGYNLDNFSGTIDRSINEFQSVNNDGGRAVNDPTVFRRIQCFSPESRPHVAVEPPPFFPRPPTSGCSRW